MASKYKMLVRFKVQYTPSAAYHIGRRHGWFSLWFDNFMDASAFSNTLSRQSNIARAKMIYVPTDNIKNRLKYYVYLFRSRLG